MKLIFLGAPGAGKGTQAEIIAAELKIPTISTGNIIREALANGTEMGLKAKSFIEAGKLVPDDVVIGIIKDRLAADDCAGGFILDGFPRTIPQAEALDNMGVIIDKVVDIDVLVCLHTHNGKVHRPQPQLGQNTCQNGRNSKGRVQQTGHHACQCAGQKRNQNTDPNRYTHSDQHCADTAAGTDRSVHSQIRKVQNLIGDVDTNGHHTPNQALCDRSWQCIGEKGQP